jgi:hypothetical protein
MRYKITMQSGREIEFFSPEKLDNILNDIECAVSLKITKNIWIITKYIESIEVINE